MSRHNAPRLEVGRTYQLDGHKRRWTLDAVQTTPDAPGGYTLVLSSAGNHHLFMTTLEAFKRLREVWS